MISTRIGNISITMNEIIFMAAYGDELKQVSISQPIGTGGTLYLTIAKYHQGVFAYRKGQWVWLAAAGYLTVDDIQILAEMIEQHFQQPD